MSGEHSIVKSRNKKDNRTQKLYRYLFCSASINDNIWLIQLVLF